MNCWTVSGFSSRSSMVDAVGCLNPKGKITLKMGDSSRRKDRWIIGGAFSSPYKSVTVFIATFWPPACEAMISCNSKAISRIESWLSSALPVSLLMAAARLLVSSSCLHPSNWLTLLRIHALVYHSIFPMSSEPKQTKKALGSSLPYSSPEVSIY